MNVDNVGLWLSEICHLGLLQS